VREAAVAHRRAAQTNGGVLGLLQEASAFGTDRPRAALAALLAVTPRT
jgi:hypothetical protein